VTDTPVPLKTPPPTETPDPVATLVTIQQPVILESATSPDGQWRVEVVRFDCTQIGQDDFIAYEQVKLVHVADGVERTITGQTQHCGGLGAFGLGGYGWSPNSRRFYFTDSREGFPDGGGPCAWHRSVLRLESATGAPETLRPGVVSPEVGLIAMPDGNDIVLWDFDDGEIARLPAPVKNTAECEHDGLVAWTIEWAAPGELRLTAQSGEQWLMELMTRVWKRVEWARRQRIGCAETDKRTETDGAPMQVSASIRLSAMPKAIRCRPVTSAVHPPDKYPPAARFPPTDDRGAHT
jgi:hypothetical protein